MRKVFGKCGGGILTALFAITLLALPAIGKISGRLFGEDLWRDHRPYGALGTLRPQAVLKLLVDEPLNILYQYDQTGDNRVVIKMAPDKNITEFLPSADVNKSSADKKLINIRLRTRLALKMGVTVSTIDNNETIAFTGTKIIAYEAGRAQLQVNVSGRVQLTDVNSQRVIRSTDVSDLRIIMRGAPLPQTKNIQMKTIPPAEAGGAPRPAAELSEREKQQLLLEYLNRVLGESADQ